MQYIDYHDGLYLGLSLHLLHSTSYRLPYRPSCGPQQGLWHGISPGPLQIFSRSIRQSSEPSARCYAPNIMQHGRVSYLQSIWTQSLSPHSNQNYLVPVLSLSPLHLISVTSYWLIHTRARLTPVTRLSRNNIDACGFQASHFIANRYLRWPPRTRGPENWSESAVPFNCHWLFLLQFVTSTADRGVNVVRLSGHRTDQPKDITPAFHWRLINSLIKLCRSSGWVTDALWTLAARRIVRNDTYCTPHDRSFRFTSRWG